MGCCNCWTFPSSPPFFSLYDSNNNSIAFSSSSSSWSFSSASHKYNSSFVAQFSETLKLSYIFNAHSTRFRINCKAKDPEVVDCLGTGLDAECLVSRNEKEEKKAEQAEKGKSNTLLEWAVLVSPFFFWGTAMVAMKEVLPKAGPFFVASFRLIPAGLLLVAFAKSKGRPLPSGLTAWLSIALFALVDASCFQGFLAQGLQRTSAGLGSVIIDSQPLTVAVLAALLFDESIGLVGAAGLALGVIGLVLLEVPALALDESNFSLWGSGEWLMLLAAQSMAVGTVMVRWVSKYSDPIMATGWELSASDVLALFYTSIFGSAISYGVYFYSATKGSLTKLSSLTFLTPMFASIFGFLYLGETFSTLQLIGAIVTIVAIYMVNFRDSLQ
ncbi:WAT1-related protein At3g02690, chloroplastic isoform X3 [Durio zibethinus]|uniref:WAT1-related protein At3g02690, chloroplastic isoform X3 n=1 Tax=Durio zibethinus TaxID=66656 RepID=A0A6P6A355_DURZI|nr:WAT1-related protein At3g02690, chloroplastic isoform X3 [Durio zibethinus]